MMTRGKLLITAVFQDTWREIAANWRALLRSLILPSLSMVSIKWAIVASAAYGMLSLILLIIGNGLMAALFAVTCHRIVLLGPEQLPNRWGLYFSRSVLKYFGYLVLIGIGVLLILLVAMIATKLIEVTTGYAGTAMDRPSWLWSGSMVVLFLALLYPSSRLGVVLPIAAIDQKTGIEAAWMLSDHQGWRLAIALILPSLVVGTVLSPIKYLISDSSNAVVLTLWSLAMTLVGAIAVVTLSCAYRQLEHNATETGNRDIAVVAEQDATA
jgi:hypothetical protein